MSMKIVNTGSKGSLKQYIALCFVEACGFQAALYG